MERYTVSVTSQRGHDIYTTRVDVDVLPVAQFPSRGDWEHETGRAAVLAAADAINHGED